MHRLDRQFDFDRYARSLQANHDACERIMGRKLTDGESNALARTVGKLQGIIQREGK